MKQYDLSISIDKEGTLVREKTSEGITLTEAKLIIATLEEYKQKMLTYVIFNQNVTDLKNQKKQ